jgi:hypothetical protein
MNTIIKSIPHSKQRYNTIGDWKFVDSTIGDPLVLDIYISDLGDNKMNALIAIHELVEAVLCRFNDPEITGEEVDKFDMSHPELEEPGEDSRAPYKKQHKFASMIEMLVAIQLNINWDEYEKGLKGYDSR